MTKFATIEYAYHTKKAPKQIPHLGQPIWHQKHLYGYAWDSLKNPIYQVHWQHFNAAQFDQIIANLYNSRYYLKFATMQYNLITKEVPLTELKPDKTGQCIGCQASEDNYGGQIAELAFINYDHPKNIINVHRNGLVETHNLKPLQIQYQWPQSLQGII